MPKDDCQDLGRAEIPIINFKSFKLFRPLLSELIIQFARFLGNLLRP